MRPPVDSTVNLAGIESRLRVEAGGRPWLLERGQPALRIGRAPDNDLVAGDDFTSRRHAALGWQDGHYYLADASRNGTFVVFADGVRFRVHGERCRLDRQGTLYLGHPTSVALVFTIEIRTAPGAGWRTAAATQGSLIRREGDYWALEHGGRRLQIRDSKGLRYLAELLWHPGREFHALDLAAIGSPGHAFTAAGAGPVLDAAARAAYRRRLGELREELAEAEAFHDVGRAPRVRAEIDAIMQQLSDAVGLGGRDRQAASDANRARVAVTQRLRHAIEQVQRHDAALGHHLAAAVRTGRFCSYCPDAAASARWEA